MPDTKKKVKVMRKGNIVEISAQIPKWRKRMKRFNKLKDKLFSFLIDHFKDADKAHAWLSTKNKELADAPPRQFINPKQIRDLVRWTKHALNANSRAEGTLHPSKEDRNGN